MHRVLFASVLVLFVAGCPTPPWVGPLVDTSSPAVDDDAGETGDTEVLETGWIDTDPADSGSDTGTSTDDTDDTDVVAVCGNGVAEPGEDCDGSDLRGNACTDLGFDRGTLACTGCAWDASACSSGPLCGDGVRAGAEACDGADFGTATCGDYGFDGGSLTCTGQCTIRTGQCTNTVTCGDGLAEGSEACDGNDLAGATCGDFGFNAGALSCDGDCELVTTGCFAAPVCGDGTRNGSEGCDGVDFGGATCDDYGFDSGALACSGGCTIDSTGCFDAPFCGDGIRNAAEACDDTDLGGAVCRDFGFVGGALGCDGDCEIDTSGCNNTAVCGDGVRTAPEACDGVDFGQDDCTTYGFDQGTLGCSGCVVDTSACVDLPPSGTWCSTSGFPIDAGAPNGVDATFSIPETGVVDEVLVSVEGNHGWLGDLEFRLVHEAIEVELADPQYNCAGYGTIDVQFGDVYSSSPSDCDWWTGDYEGGKRSADPLSVYAATDAGGDWTLRVLDTASGDGGTIDRWCITLNP